jgi:hypothetical protein
MIRKSVPLFLVLILQLAWLDDLTVLDHGGQAAASSVLENDEYLPCKQSQVVGNSRKLAQPFAERNHSFAGCCDARALDDQIDKKLAAPANHRSLECLMSLLC